MKRNYLFIVMMCAVFVANAQNVDSLCCRYDNSAAKASDLESALKNPKLTVADLSMQSPKLTKVPEELAVLTSLKCLDLSYNRIAGFSENFKNLVNLTCLDLSGNHYLQKLPAFLNEMPNLKVIQLKELNWSAAKKKEMEKTFPNITFVW
jgi:Leucine-rich repeat (LRR) protein